MKAQNIVLCLMLKFCFANINEIPDEEKVTPGQYSQWREILPLENPKDPDWVPNCHEKCTERCGNAQKGVSICGSMFEYADDPLKDEVNRGSIPENSLIPNPCPEWDNQ